MAKTTGPFQVITVRGDLTLGGGGVCAGAVRGGGNMTRTEHLSPCARIAGHRGAESEGRLQHTRWGLRTYAITLSSDRRRTLGRSET